MPPLIRRSVKAAAPTPSLPPLPQRPSSDDPIGLEIAETLDLISPSPPQPSMSVPLAPDIIPVIKAFCAAHGYTYKAVVDVALRDYLNLPEPPDDTPAHYPNPLPSLPSIQSANGDTLVDPATLNSLDNFLDDGV